MQTNPCYGDHTLPVYEGVQLQDKTEIRLKPTEKVLSSKINCSTSINKTNLFKCNIVVVALSLLAIAMVAALALSAYALVGSNQGMDSLMEEIQALKTQLNKTKQTSETDIADLKKDLNYTLTRIETDGLNSLNTTNLAQLSNLLNAQANSSVNIYQNCIQETRRCTMRGSSSPAYYVRSCFTSRLSINRTVS